MSISGHRYASPSDNNNTIVAEAAQATTMWSPPPYAAADDSPAARILNFNLNHVVTDEEEGSSSASVPKEPLFQKPLTPSDVGKLNRLVIPKQHAERYFPLCGGGGGGEKGLLLSFEDEVGKCWRFRYSYWNSSQSYVLTKGWSRFVKEKRLDAGDVVLFLRHRNDCGRMFIGWRRKGGGDARPTGGGGGGSSWRSEFYYPQGVSSMANYSHGGDYSNYHAANQLSTKPVNKSSNSKRLRLFGVNLECQPTEGDRSEPSTPVGSPMSTSQGQAANHHQQQQYHHQYYNYYTNNYYTFRSPDI